MLTHQQQEQFNEIFNDLVNNLDITESQYIAAVNSYKAVGDWLSKEESSIAPYKPQILPQGSFLIGTMIKPINEDDELDIDLVCELTGKRESWTQRDLKSIVGDRIKENKTYKEMLADEGRRCWTLNYRENSKQPKDKYHMDILPSIVNEGYFNLRDKMFSAMEDANLDSLAIRITDKETNNYYTENNIEYWMKSNPFGYAQWFNNRTKLSEYQAFSLRASIKPVPDYQKNKLPLQRVVQILKRHRDIMFSGDENKPISIIITTLSAKAYNKETNLVTALSNVISNMEKYIESKYDASLGRYVKYIPNPINSEENFADKWIEHPIREEKFYEWLEKIKSDMRNILNKTDGIHLISEAMIEPFGKELVQKTFSDYGSRLSTKSNEGELNVLAGTGTIGGSKEKGTPIKKHNFYGFTKKNL